MTAPTRWIAGEESVSGPAPYMTGGNTHRSIVRAWVVVALAISACGVVLFGFKALSILAVSTVSALMADGLLVLATRRRTPGRTTQAFLTGLLVGLTLPANAPPEAAVLASLVAILVGSGLLGGLLHPALLGRVVVQFVFSQSLSLGSMGALAFSPVLAPGHLLFGDLSDAARARDYQGWLVSQEDFPKDAFSLERPVQSLRKFAMVMIEPDGELTYSPLIRDHLPPWEDTIVGAVPGGIGETCSLMLLIGGLYLIYRGYLRWQLPVVVLASAALAASILPVDTASGYDWFPAITVEEGRAVGLAYVFYHLTAGQLMLGAFILCGDVFTSPMRIHGQLVFAVGVGVLTIFLRLYGPLEGECYWSILIMNLLVGTIDRTMKRPVLGMG